MIMDGVADHPSDFCSAFADSETAECLGRRLNHGEGEAEKFYRARQQSAAGAGVGTAATGYARRFERLPVASSSAATSG